MSSSPEIELIKTRLDIVSIVSQYVQLKPAGVNHKGLCPFHKEKSPSFMVNKDRQSWHCFGCNKGGDIFSFVQEVENMEFKEALHYLAEKAGVVLTNQFDNGVGKNERARLKEAVVEAARFLHKFLLSMPQSASAREYLAKRGLKPETVEEWQIGYAPEQWDLLTQYLLKKGFSIDELVKAGITIEKEGSDRANFRGFYDRFRGRVMFPISDHNGSIVGFTGRVLVETEKSGGKYVNTPQTLIFDKSRLIFGLDKAKQAIRESGCIVLVEGQMDVVACHEAGMRSVVASSGTAMTEEHAKLLYRYGHTIAMAFDQDKAGIAAAKRGIEIALTQGFQIKVIAIPDGFGKDPDECVRGNKEVWFQAVKNAQDVLSWYFERTFANQDLHSPHVKQLIANELVPLILRIPHAIEQDHWLRELASGLQVDVSVLREQGKKMQNQQPLKIIKEKPSASDAVSAEKPKENPLYASDRVTLLVKRLLVLCLRNPSFFLIFGPQFPDISAFLSTDILRALYENIKNSYTEANIQTLHSLDLNYNNQNIVDILIMQGEMDFSQLQKSDIEREISLVLKELRAEWKRLRRLDLLQQIEVAEKIGDKNRATDLISLFQSIQ